DAGSHCLASPEYLRLPRPTAWPAAIQECWQLQPHQLTGAVRPPAIDVAFVIVDLAVGKAPQVVPEVGGLHRGRRIDVHAGVLGDLAAEQVAVAIAARAGVGDLRGLCGAHVERAEA